MCKPRIREGVVAAGIAGLLSLGMAGGVAGAATTVPWHGPSPGVMDNGTVLTVDTNSGVAAEIHLNAPIVGRAFTPNRNGEWLVAADGGVFAFGDAKFYGSMAGKHLNAPIVGMASTPTGQGYWLVAADGGVFAFGDAPFYGSVPGAPSSEQVGQPIVKIVAIHRYTAGAWGYDLTTAEGTVYAFGGQFPLGYGGVALSTT